VTNPEKKKRKKGGGGEASRLLPGTKIDRRSVQNERQTLGYTKGEKLNGAGKGGTLSKAQEGKRTREGKRNNVDGEKLHSTGRN